jgi:hypothetical protein
MTINSDVDINLAIEKLGKNNNEYRLSQSNPPHTIIEWRGPDAQPSDDDINSAWTSWKTNDQYKDKRLDEYPSVVDQLDDIYHNGIDGWKATIKTTKDKYPKP